jgi:hypothetical protein
VKSVSQPPMCDAFCGFTFISGLSWCPILIARGGCSSTSPRCIAMRPTRPLVRPLPLELPLPLALELPMALALALAWALLLCRWHKCCLDHCNWCEHRYPIPTPSLREYLSFSSRQVMLSMMATVAGQDARWAGLFCHFVLRVWHESYFAPIA